METEKIRLQLITNKKSYLGFWYVQKSMTLNDFDRSVVVYIATIFFSHTVGSAGVIMAMVV